MWWFVFLLIGRQCAVVQTSCSPPTKFYVDCALNRSVSDAISFCTSHQMILVNLTNSSGTLVNDINILNQSFVSKNCAGYFWFASGNQTNLVVNVSNLGGLLSGLLSGILNVVLCLIPFLCPVTTTPAPITSAFTVCTRSTQQTVIQKCSNQIIRSDMQVFQFAKQNMLAGLLDSFASQSITACSALCSSSDLCIGISYGNGTCNLYM